jgi:proteasome lid subunit RPN8/RPN11
MPETIYDALRESHERQRSLLRQLLRSKAGTRERIDLLTQTRIELEAHEAAEERYLYAPMLMEDKGLDSARHALHEHHQIDELVADLQKLAPAGDAWIETARELSKEVHHHLREEEKKFFQVSGKILSDAQKTRLAAQYRKDYQRMQRKLAAE